MLRHQNCCIAVQPVVKGLVMECYRISKGPSILFRLTPRPFHHLQKVSASMHEYVSNRFCSKDTHFSRTSQFTLWYSVWWQVVLHKFHPIILPILPLFIPPAQTLLLVCPTFLATKGGIGRNWWPTNDASAQEVEHPCGFHVKCHDWNDQKRLRKAHLGWSVVVAPSTVH